MNLGPPDNKDKWYRQCGLRRPHPDPDTEGDQVDVAYIPDRVAKVGQHVRVGDEKPLDDDPWLVEWVSPTRRSWRWLMEKRNADKKQRKASDI